MTRQARSTGPRRLVLALAVALHCALATAFAVRLPALEGPDEADHLDYARHLIEVRELPLVRRSAAELGRPPHHQENLGHHPPLYYALLAGVQVATGNGDLVPVAAPSGYTPGEPLPPLVRLHGWDERAPVSSEVRALRLLRGLSVVLGAITIVLVHRLARLVHPDRPAVAGAAAVALASAPVWWSAHGVLDNGSLATTLATACTLVLARIALDGTTRRRALAAGVLLGLALATKLTALFLVPVAGLVALVAVARASARRAAFVDGLVLAGVAALLAGPFFARNVALYGEPLASEVHRRGYAESVVPQEHVRDWLVHKFPALTLESFVGAVAVARDAPPRSAGWLALGLLALGALGWLARPRACAGRGAGSALLALVALLVALAYVRFNATFAQAQARYLLPGLGPLAVLVAAGWVSLGRGLAAALAAAAAAAGVAVFALRVVPLTELGEPPADRHQAALVAGVRAAVAPADAQIELVAPPDGAVLAAPPQIVWTPPPDTPEDARWSVYLVGPDGAFLGGSVEHAGAAGTEPRYAVPAQLWSNLPAGEPLRWKVRRLPDRSRGENAADAPESATRTFVRAP